MIATIKKIRGRSLSELAERGRQQVRILQERTGLARDIRWPTDREFLNLFAGLKLSNPSQLQAHLYSQKFPFRLLPGDSEAGISRLKERFPAEVSHLIDQSERVREGRYDLLGHTGLSFGSGVPDWHLDPVSGRRAPIQHWSLYSETDSTLTGDKKIIWELNRHQYLTAIGRLYLINGDERLAETFVSHVSSWLEANPPKSGVNWLSSLEIAYRSISWIWALGLFEGSPLLTPELFISILKCLYLNGRHLAGHLSIYSSPNTHLTGEALGLYLLGAYLHEIPEAAGWRETGYKILISSLEAQVRDDGGHVEQAIHYHRYTAEIYLYFYLVLRAEGRRIDKTFAKKVRGLLHYLLHVTEPNGQLPSIGDEDGGRLFFLEERPFAEVRSTLAVGAVLFDDPELKFAAGYAGPEVLWLLGSEGLDSFDKIPQRAPGELNYQFDQTGIFTARSGWDRKASHLVIDCGPHGYLNGGHAHADALSFVLSVRGIPVFIDSGTFCYTSDGESRNYFRSSLAHNCLAVDGLSSSEPAGPFTWKSTAAANLLEWSPGESGVVFRGTHDGYSSVGVNYEREIRFDAKHGLTCFDRVECRTEHRFEVGFILDPGIIAEVKSPSRIELRTKDGNELVLVIDTKVAGGVLTEEIGWSMEPANISPRYGKLVRSARISYSVVGSGGIQITNSALFDSYPE